MSDCFDHEADAWEDLAFGRTADDEYGAGQSTYPYANFTLPRKNKSKKVKCKQCGKKKLHWTNTENGWRLCTKKGKIHDCLKNFKCSINKH